MSMKLPCITPECKTMKHQIVNMIVQDVKKTIFMQHAGMFEPFKVVITPMMELKIDPNVTINDEWVQKVRNKLDNKDFKIIALYDDEQVFFRDENVKVVSNGNNFSILDNYLPNVQLQ